MKTKTPVRSNLRKLQSLAALGMGLGILGCGGAFAASGVSMEAENMTLTNYAVNANSSASNGNLIKVNAGATGTAFYTFSGSTGTYDIKVWYYDENDGACALKLYVNGVVVDSWTANLDLGSADPVAATRTSRTKAGVSITNGQEIKLEGTQNSQEWARFDNVEVTAVGGLPSGTTMEAEIMALTNYATEAVSAASGGSCIKVATGATGNGRYSFSGTTGTYDIKVWYFDENDGACALKLYVNNVVVDSWTANLDLGSAVPDAATRTSRTKAAVSISNGNEIKIEGTQNADAWARFDLVEVTASGGSPPAAPTGLTATPGNAQVALSWNASTGATSYNVKRSTTSGGPYSTVGSPTTTSFTNTGLTNGTTYFYVVSAVNTAGESANSSQVSATPSAGPSGETKEAEDMTLTNYVVNTNTSASNGNLIKLSASGVTGTASFTFSGSTGTYDLKVWYYDENDGACPMKVYVAGVVVDSWTANLNLGSADPVAATRTSRTKAGVSITNGNEIKLEATQNSQEWGRFDLLEVLTPSAPPTPTGLTATAGNAQVALSWNASSGATSYNVKRSTTSGGPYTTVGSPTTNSFTNTGLTNGTTYFYVVSAVNAIGESANSAQVSAMPTATSASITVNFTAPLGTVNPRAIGIDVSGYGGKVLANDTLMMTRMTDVNMGQMRVDLKYTTSGDPNSPIIHGGVGAITSVTGDQWIDAIKATGAEPIIVASMTVTNYTTDAVNLLKHFNQQTNNRVGYWILGNESQIPGSEQIARFNQMYDAMKAVDSTIKIAGFGLADFNQTFLQQILDNCGSRIDAVDFHKYGQGGTDNLPEATLLANTVSYEDRINTLRQMIQTTVPSRASEIDIQIGEWNTNWNTQGNVANMYTQFNTVWGASVLGHIIHGGGLSLQYADKNLALGALYEPNDDRMPIYYAHFMFSGGNLFRQFGTTLVTATTTLTNVEVFASDNMKNIVVINKDPSVTKNATFSLVGVSSGTAGVWQKNTSINTLDPPGNLGSVTITNGAFSYNLAPYSVTTFVIN